MAALQSSLSRLMLRGVSRVARRESEGARGPAGECGWVIIVVEWVASVRAYSRSQFTFVMYSKSFAIACVVPPWLVARR